MAQSNPAVILQRIREAAARCGIPDCGTASFAGCAPLLPCRAAERLPDGAKTVIVCVFPYRTPDVPHNISRYALVQDYHKIAGGMLEEFAAALKGMFPENSFAPFVDNSPIREVDAAGRAGLGVRGLHTMLIHPVYGSWVFLGSVVTDLEVNIPDCPQKSCIGCGACVNKCKFGAISINEYGVAEVEEEKCIGCGACAKVCPQKVIHVHECANYIVVKCSNRKKGGEAKKQCEVSCIGCGICEKTCTASAIRVIDNCAVIEESMCLSCGMCAVKCPRHAIHDLRGIFTAVR